MGVVVFPRPATLATYIAQEEMARRFAGSFLPADRIFRYGAMVASHIQSSPSLPRAMDEVRRQIQAAAENNRSFASGSVLFAETLSNGKGRFQRSWHAPTGGIWLVAALFNQWLPATTQLLPLVAGVSACETLRSFGLAAELKWVNDVVVGGRKICGILCETFSCPATSEEYILVGLGLNVNNSHFPAELADVATSMKGCAGHDFDLGRVALDLLAKLRWNIGLLTYEEEEQEGDHGHFMAAYRALCASCGRRVAFGFDVQNHPQYEALVTAIADDGGIILHHLRDGVEVVEHGGEIHYLD